MAIATTFYRTSLLVLVIGALIFASRAAYGLNGAGLGLKEAEQMVLTNPGLAQVREKHNALMEIPSQLGALPDPVININAMNFPVDGFHRRQEPMTQLQIGVMQTIPFPGKLALKSEAAEFEAQAFGHSVAELKLQLIQQVRHTWWQIYYLDHALDTVQNNQQLFRESIEIALKKYETGVGLQQDVLLAQMELSRLFDQQIQLEAMRQDQAIALNVLIDQPQHQQITLAYPDPLPLPELKAKQDYFDLAQSRPRLMQAKASIDAARTRQTSAERDYLPDFNVGVNYGDRRGDNVDGSSRDDFLSIMVGIKIPLYANSRQNKALRQRQREVQSVTYALSDTQGQIYAAITQAMNSYQRAHSQFELFKTTLLPQARQTVHSMIAGYQVNEVDFLNLIRAQITLLNYELQYWRAFTEAKQSLAALESAVGEGNIYE